MSDIALYNLLKRIPDATDDEVEKAVADVASSKDMATKSDIYEIKVAIAKLETELKYLRWLIVVVVGIAVAIIKYLPT